MTAAIRNTLPATNLNTEVVDEYLRLTGEIEFTSNHNRKLTACVNHKGLKATFIVGRAELTGKPAYKYRAFKLLVTLDLEIYKATRRLIVPADLEFDKLHKVLQRVFDWKGYHLYDFAVFDGENQEPVTRLVPDQEGLSHDYLAVVTTGRTLSDYFWKYSNILLPTIWVTIGRIILSSCVLLRRIVKNHHICLKQADRHHLKM